MLTLSTPCFVVEDDEIVERTLGYFDNLIETAPRHDGIGYKYYVTGSGTTWALVKWSTQKGAPVVVRGFDDRLAADRAAEEIHVQDILGSVDVDIFLDLEDAEQFLLNMADGA